VEAKYAHQLETMYFSSDSELNLRSDSTADLDDQEQTVDAQPIIDDELESQIMEALCNVKPEENVQ
jgi:hypothetical protein